MVVVDRCQFKFTVLPAASLNCSDHATYIYNFNFLNSFNVICRLFKVKDDIF